MLIIKCSKCDKIININEEQLHCDECCEYSEIEAINKAAEEISNNIVKRKITLWERLEFARRHTE